MPQSDVSITNEATTVLRGGQSSSPTRVDEILALLFFSFVGAGGVLVLAEWPLYHDILTPVYVQLGFNQTLLILWTVWSKSIVCLGPLLLLVSLMAWRRRTKTAWFILLAISVVFYCALVTDLRIYRTYGRHLTELAALADRPNAFEYVGGLDRWMKDPAILFVVLVLIFPLSAWCLRAVFMRYRSSASFVRRPKGIVTSSVLMVLVVVMPLFLRSFADGNQLFGMIMELFPLDTRSQQQRLSGVQSDPVLAELQVRLTHTYSKWFDAHKKTPAPHDPDAYFDAVNKPNVIVIVLESLNQKVVEAGAMPKLMQRAKTGLVLERHYSGSNHTEGGLFTLFYGRSMISYHPSLDHGIRPQLCVSLERSGYRTGYYTGDSPSWGQSVRFLNDRTFTHFGYIKRQYNPPLWDVLAMENMLGDYENNPRPFFGCAFLISSHYPYQYVEGYEDIKADTSYATSGHYWTSEDLDLLKHYQASLRFLDDEIDRLVSRLDLSRTVVVVTGDHGESFHDDGSVSHATRFSDAQTCVPCVIFGAGVQPEKFSARTTHADLLPTLLHLISGKAIPIKGVSGRDLLAGPFEDRLVVGNILYKTELRLMLLNGPRHRLVVSCSTLTPKVLVMGFENDQAVRLLNHRVSREDIPELVSTFEKELELVSPIPPTEKKTTPTN